MKNLKFSILIPTYNAEKIVEETIRSILSQSFSDFELIIQDDKSKDNTLKVVRSIKDGRIKIFKNEKNLGYSLNLEEGRKHCSGDILYLMGQDDILAENALKNTYLAFKNNPEIGAVTRPYYWFSNDIHTPVRAKKQLNPKKNQTISISSSKEKVIRVIDTLDQLSGLAYRVRFMDRGFHPDIFPCHIYPFISILKKHKVCFLKDYNIAVRISSSQTRFLSSIYDKSPLLSWVEMVRDILREKKYVKIREYLIKDFIAVNYVGLVQIKNFSKFPNLLREIYYLIKFRPMNLLSPAFWFFSLGTAVIPPSLLIPMVDKYKESIYSKQLTNIRFKYKD